MAKNIGIGRQRAAIGMARATSSAEARLIHNEMAATVVMGVCFVSAGLYIFLRIP